MLVTFFKNIYSDHIVTVVSNRYSIYQVAKEIAAARNAVTKRRGLGPIAITDDKFDYSQEEPLVGPS